MSRIRSIVKSVIDVLPSKARTRVIQAGIQASLREGYEKFPSLVGTLRALKRRGFSPRFAVDIGAFKGEWASEVRDVFPECGILMIEAQRERIKELQIIANSFSGDGYVEQALLGAKDNQEVIFYQAENASGVFQEQGFCESVPVKSYTKSLDTLLAKNEYRKPIDLLKIDTQGYELEVLKGGKEALARTEMVLLEVSLLQINKGCPLAIEVLQYMAREGFRWIDVCGQWRKVDKSLWQLDLLFCRPDSKWMPSAELDGPTSS